MDAAIFSSESYRFDSMSVPFIVATSTIALMGLYVAFMRGAVLLRLSFMLLCAGALPFVASYGLIASSVDLDVSLALARYGIAPVPLCGVGVVLFDLALSRQLHKYKWFVWLLAPVAIASCVTCAVTDLVIEDVWVTPSGIAYGLAGPLGFLHTFIPGAGIVVGSVALWRALRTETSDIRRRQYKGALWSFSICLLAVVDGALAYGIGWMPVGWAFFTIGALIGLRALLADDMLHAVAFDRRAVLVLFEVAVAGALLWAVLAALEDRGGSASLAAAGVVGIYLLSRVSFGLGGLMLRSERVVDTPLDRAYEKFVLAAREATSVEEVASALEDLVVIGVGAASVTLILPSSTDYSWSHANGNVLPESQTPDPRLLSWLTERSDVLERDDLETARLGDMRGPLERQLDTLGAEIVIPLASGDDLVGLVLLGALPSLRALRPDERGMLSKAREHAAASLVYVSMVSQATRNVELSKEVELAAAVQDRFVPGNEVLAYRSVRVCGLYAPASVCGGDWWTSRELSDGRVLILIGDVTGHGVPAALVTAAAKGCYDAALRLMGDDVDVVRLLELLHMVVCRSGATGLHMTCFATLIDPARSTLTFASAGHNPPYVYTPCERGVGSLDALVARGNPLGSSGEQTYRAHERPFAAGDVVVWYTDGLVECTNAANEPYGERRFRRSLMRVAASHTDVGAIRDDVFRHAMAFQSGYPAADDITLVVGRLG